MHTHVHVHVHRHRHMRMHTHTCTGTYTQTHMHRYISTDTPNVRCVMTETHRNTLQHTLQHIYQTLWMQVATWKIWRGASDECVCVLQLVATRCNSLQLAATHWRLVVPIERCLQRVYVCECACTCLYARARACVCVCVCVCVWVCVFISFLSPKRIGSFFRMRLGSLRGSTHCNKFKKMHHTATCFIEGCFSVQRIRMMCKLDVVRSDYLCNSTHMQMHTYIQHTATRIIEGFFALQPQQMCEIAMHRPTYTLDALACRIWGGGTYIYTHTHAHANAHTHANTRTHNHTARGTDA